MKGQGRALTNKLNDWLTGFCVPVLALIMRLFRHQLRGLHPPHCLGGHVRFTVIHDRLLSGIWSGTLQSHLEYRPYRFYPRSQKQQEAKVGLSQVTGGDVFRWTESHTHAYIPDISCWDHWVAMPRHIRVCRQQADCSGFWDATPH